METVFKSPKLTDVLAGKSFLQAWAAVCNQGTFMYTLVLDGD
jgi:hypothetical protein